LLTELANALEDMEKTIGPVANLLAREMALKLQGTLENRE